MNLFKKSDKKINVRSILPKFILMWSRIHKFVFAIFFAVLVGLGAYIWYQSIYSGQWSADKKQQYLDSQEKSVTLKEREFNKTLDDIEQRKRAFDADYQPIKDIFIPYPGAPTQ
jgi:hypothetical protein